VAHHRLGLAAVTLSLLIGISASAGAQKKYDPGASGTEIRIGNVMSYTGWSAPYGALGRAEAAYFKMTNDRGGVNGRKINFISLDSASDPNNALALTRQLVEQEQVLLLFSSIGAEGNLAARGYLNDNKVPQLFVDSASQVFNDPAHFPWTMGFFATYHTEGLEYARYILQNKPDAKIAVLYANDDGGHEYLAGVHDGLGDRARAMIVKELSYQVSDSSLDPQVEALKDSGANVFINFSIGPFATQTIRKAYDLGWHPLQFIPNASLSIAAFIDPAGLEKAVGIITNARGKGYIDQRNWTDPAVREFVDWMHQYNPQAPLRDANYLAGYERAQVLVEVLKRCGDELTRANVMKQATNLDLQLGMLRPEIKIKTTPTDYQPIHQLYLVRFDGKNWVPFSGVISD
jgi:branched-chain amino acid transport system substrate-binding protein